MARARPMGPACWLPGLVVVTLLLPVVEPGKFKCPSFTKLTDDEFIYPDPEQCDKYWTCIRGESKRTLCPDGLVFNPSLGKGEEPCDQRQNTPDKCEGRTKLQRPKPGDARCPRQNGVYASDDPYECDTYFSCLNGKASSTKCAQGLHYSDTIGTCAWPRESGREDCISDDDAPEEKRRKKQKAGLTPDVTTRKPAAALSNGFKCPGGAIGVHLALPHPKDCRLYYVCLDGITPSDAGCTHGTVFNPTTHQCDNPGNVEGCEFYYNPAGKKKKEEQEKSIASKVGADITSNDFNQFLKLLKMTGVLGGNSVNDAFQGILGGSGFKQGKGLGGGGGRRKGLGGGRRQGLGGGGGRRKRPKKLRQRPARAQRPQYDDYDDYNDYAVYDDEYDAPVSRPRGPLQGSKRPFVQRPRPIGNDRQPNLASTQPDDLRDTVRATPIRTTQQDRTPPSIEPTPPPTSPQGLFSVPKNRKNIFTSRFIPKVKAVGNLENIHPTGLSQSVTVTEVKVKSPVQPVKQAAVPNLSGKEAADLFSSLFPTIAVDPPEALPVPQPIAAPEPKIAQVVTTQPTIREQKEEAPRRAFIPSPLSRPRSRTSLFNRRLKAEVTPIPSVKETTTKVEEIIEVLTTTKSPGILGRTVSNGRKSLFSTKNRFRSRPNVLRKAKEVPSPTPPQIVTEAITEQELVITKKPEIQTPLLRTRQRFPFSPTPSPIEEQVTEDNIINTDDLVEETFTTPKSFIKQSPRKAFRSLLKSRSQNRLSVSVPKMTMKDKRPSLPSTIPPAAVHLPDPVPELVTESHSLLVKQIPTSPTQIPQRVRADNRRLFPVSIEPAFLHPINTLPVRVTTSPITQFDEAASQSSIVIASHVENSVRSRSRARGRANTIVSQDQIVRAQPISEPERFPKGRSSFVSEPLDNVADREEQRITAHKVRNQLKDYLPEAENEGDAYEKLRAKIERIQNRNKARSRG